MHWSRIKVITLTAMCFALFMAVTDDTVLNVALPQIQTSLGSKVSGLQWILNAYTLPAASLLLMSGTLGDIYGRKRVFLIGVVIFTVASMVCGLAPSLNILIAGRILQGIGAAALIPTSLSIVTATFPKPQEQTNAIAIWSAISGLALIVGPILGGILVDVYGWQSTFFMNVPFGAISFVITYRFVKETKHKRKRRIDVLGLVLSIVFLASFIYALTEANNGVWHSPFILTLLTVAGVSLLAFLFVESHSSHPMLPLKLFKNSAFAVVNVVQVLVMFTLVSLLFVFSLFLQQIQGYSAVAAGMRFLPLNAAFIIALLVSGWLAARLGWRFTIATGAIVAGVTTLSFIQIDANTEYGAIVGKLVISGFGAGLTIAPLAAAAMNSARSTQEGIASAVLNTSNRLGGVLGIAIQGTILSHWLTADLRRSLSNLGLPSNIQEQLLANSLRGGIEIPERLLSGIPKSVMARTLGDAFVSGLHVTVFIASLALLIGAALIIVFLPPKLKKP